MAIPIKSNGSSKLPEATYLSPIWLNELAKERKYTAIWQDKAKLIFSEVEAKARQKTVDWIKATGRRANYADETVHLAVYLVDAFTTLQTIQLECWNLLGLSAVHIAAKMEEVNPVKINLLLSKYKPQSSRFTYNTVIWMERQIIKTLDFNLSPPSVKLFVDLAVNSMQSLCPRLKRTIQKLACGILLRSLSDISFIRRNASEKAQMAVEVATECVMFHRSHPPKQQYKPGYFSKVPDTVFINLAGPKSYDVFKERFSQPSVCSLTP